MTHFWFPKAWLKCLTGIDQLWGLEELNKYNSDILKDIIDLMLFLKCVKNDITDNN